MKVETDCEHEWEPLEFEGGEKSKASVCSKCGALRSGQGSIVITANYIDFSPLTSNPTLAEGRQWFRSDFDAMYWSPDGSVIERMKTIPPGIASGSLAGIKRFEYLVEGDPTDSWAFTMNPSAGVWIKQYSTAASFNAQMVYHGAYQHWTGDNTFVDVPNKADNVYGAGEEVTVHQVPDGTLIGGFIGPGSWPYVMTWDGEYLWVADRNSGTIYKTKRDGTVVGNIANPPGTDDIRGLTWDATYLWMTDNVSGYIYQIDDAGTEISSFPSPNLTSPHGLTFDGEYLWHSDGASGTIYKLTPTGAVKDRFASPAGGPKGLAWDGRYLWHGDAVCDGVYQLTTAGTQISWFPGTVADAGCYGECWDGSYLWVSEETPYPIYMYSTAGSFDLNYKIAPT